MFGGRSAQIDTYTAMTTERPSPQEIARAERAGEINPNQAAALRGQAARR